MDGQLSLFDFTPKSQNLVRTECLMDKSKPCNILNTHDVAKELGIDCQYGCCNACKDVEECGARCNNVMREKLISQDREERWQCYYCKYINRDKKKITGVHKNIYVFGCRKLDSGYVPGGAAIGDEDTWLKMCGCGMFEMGRDT